MRRQVKDPDATVDYTVDWSAWLDGDTITAAAAVVPAGIGLDHESHTGTVHTIWLTGGTPGQSYVVTSRVTTAGGRVDDRSFIIDVRDR